MASLFSPRTSATEVVFTSEAAVDHALALLLANQSEAALRWSAAALEAAPWMPDSHLVTARALAQMRHPNAAVDALLLAIAEATYSGNLPIALAAINELRLIGCDVGRLLDRLARTFCRDSARLNDAAGQPMLDPHTELLQPLDSSLAGAALAATAARIIRGAKRRLDAPASEPPPMAPLPLFGALSEPSLRSLLEAFQVKVAPAGHQLFTQEGEATTVYLIARGEVEVSPPAASTEGEGAQDLVRLASGAFVGEMGLLSRGSNVARVTTTRPSILLVADRDVLLAFARRRPELAIELGAHGRRNAFANLARTSRVLAPLRGDERAALAERFEMRFFDRGDRLAVAGMEAEGLHFIVSGEVAMVARDYGAYAALPNLGPGDTFGEVELVLWQRSYTDAVATRPTATLFLSRQEYAAVAQHHPNLLIGLYGVAMRRRAETRFALQARSVPALPPPRVSEMDGRQEARMLALLPERLPPGALGVLHPSSTPPVSTSSDASPSPSWATFAGAALGAATASIVILVALTNRHAAVPDAAVAAGTAPITAMAPAATALPAPPAPSATTPENSLTTSVRTVSPAANRARIKTKPVAERTRPTSITIIAPADSSGPDDFGGRE
jgi:CRP-like cAMP-binding protein